MEASTLREEGSCSSDERHRLNPQATDDEGEEANTTARHSPPKMPKTDFMALLKDCAKHKNLRKGAQLHDAIAAQGLLRRSTHLANAVVNMYVKCGALETARSVLEQIPSRNAVSFSALISGYAQRGRSRDALSCFDLMRGEGIAPDAVSFACVLKACGDLRDLDRGNRIHHEIAGMGLMKEDVVLGTALVDMYAKCGALDTARRIFDELPSRDVVTWSALISGYAHRRRGHDALKCFETMLHERIPPNSTAFVSALKACGSIGAIDEGKQIHEMIARRGGLLAHDAMLGNALVDMYAKCGALEKARQVLRELPVRNVVSWNALIAEYARRGQCLQALRCFRRMQRDGLSPDDVTLICTLKACGSVGSIEEGERIHAEIRRRRSMDGNALLGNALVDMYAKCGALGKAREVLEALPVRDTGTWNALIAGYVDHDRGSEALESFEQMQCEGVSPDRITFTCMLKACGNLGMVEKGEQIHQEIVSKSLSEADIILGNALVEMYVKCGAMKKARGVLGGLPDRNVISWSTLIAGYAHRGSFPEALNCFEHMRREGCSPNVVTFACMLKACGSMGAIDKGQNIHDELASKGLLGVETVLDCALVDMYAKCGELAKARMAFQGLSTQNVAAWNALISGYTQQGQCHEALECFDQMRNEGCSPDEITFICALRTCGKLGAIHKGERIHEEIVSQNLLEEEEEEEKKKEDSLLRNALVDMYTSCGCLAKARQVLDEAPVRTAAAWNALIRGYSRLGKCEEASNCLYEMQSEGLSSPHDLTFRHILRGFSHSGISNKTQMVYEKMTKSGNASGLEQHTCMAVVCGYAGHFDEAFSTINVMANINLVPAWLALLEACRKWGNVKLGMMAFDRVIRLDSACAAAYAIVADILAAAEMEWNAKRMQERP